jgi:hypothetical protein
VKCAIVQPSYLPWRGYFHMIEKADVFVFYDDVQYDKHGWRNRNRIKTASGPRWLTVPVAAGGNVETGLPIYEVRIADHRWQAKHLKTIRQAYARAPHVDRCLELLEPHLSGGQERLADLTVALTIALAEEFGLRREFVRSSELGLTGDRMGRLIEALQRVGATQYISGPAARSYLDEGRLAEFGISVEYMTYDYPEYGQLHPPFEPQVSVIDLLAMEGVRAPSLIWG